MNPLFAAAVAVEAFCAAHGWRSSVIGGLAVQRWGEPRQTRDVDITILTGLGGEERFIDPILGAYRSRVPNGRQFAIERRVVLVETAEGIPLDISLGGLPYEHRVIDRASPFAVEPGIAFITCSAEDLVVLKAFADRPQDWLDIEGIVVRQSGTLNRTIIREELSMLLDLKEDLEPLTHLAHLFDEHPG